MRSSLLDLGGKIFFFHSSFLVVIYCFNYDFAAICTKNCCHCRLPLFDARELANRFAIRRLHPIAPECRSIPLNAAVNAVINVALNTSAGKHRAKRATLNAAFRCVASKCGPLNASAQIGCRSRVHYPGRETKRSRRSLNPTGRADSTTPSTIGISKRVHFKAGKQWRCQTVRAILGPVLQAHTAFTTRHLRWRRGGNASAADPKLVR